MKTRGYSILNIVATGVVVLVLLFLGLFWARFLCRRTHHRLLAQATGDVRIQPSRLFDFEQNAEPNVLTPSVVSARMIADCTSFAGLGIARYVVQRLV